MDALPRKHRLEGANQLPMRRPRPGAVGIARDLGPGRTQDAELNEPLLNANGHCGLYTTNIEEEFQIPPHQRIPRSQSAMHHRTGYGMDVDDGGTDADEDGDDGDDGDSPEQGKSSKDCVRLPGKKKRDERPPPRPPPTSEHVVDELVLQQQQYEDDEFDGLAFASLDDPGEMTAAQQELQMLRDEDDIMSRALDADSAHGFTAANTGSNGRRHSALPRLGFGGGAGLSADARDAALPLFEESGYVSYHGVSVRALMDLYNRLENMQEAASVRLYVAQVPLGMNGPIMVNTQPPPPPQQQQQQQPQQQQQQPQQQQFGPETGTVPAGTTLRYVMLHRDEWMLLEEPCSGTLVRAQLDSLELKIRRRWTLEDMCQHVVLPLSARRDRIYVDLLDTTQRSPERFQGAFVSAPHCSAFADLVDALESFCRGNLTPFEDQYVWIDIFCANQKRLAGLVPELDSALPQQPQQQQQQQQQQHSSRFGVNGANSSPGGIISNDAASDGRESLAEGRAAAHVSLRRARSLLLHLELPRLMHHFKESVLFLDRWDKPLALSRAWCVYEIYKAILDKSEVHVLFRDGEQDRFINTLSKNFDTVTERLLEIDIRNAGCHDADDCEMIRNAISKLQGGFSQLNSTLLAKLREMFQQWTRAAVKQRKKQIDGMRRQMDEVRAAAAAAGPADDDLLLRHPGAVGDMEARLRARELRLARLYNQAGRFETAQRKESYDRALEYYHGALQIYRDRCGRDSAQSAAVLNNLALLKRKRGELDSAMEDLIEVERIQRRIFEECRDRADRGSEVNSFVAAEGSGSSSSSNESGATQQPVSVTAPPPPPPPPSSETACTDASESSAMDVDKARLALSVTLNNLGKTCYLQDKRERALDCYMEALKLRREFSAPPDDEGEMKKRLAKQASILGNIAMVHVAKCEYRSALETYKEVMKLKRMAFGGDLHPSVATTLCSIAFLHYRVGSTVVARELYERALNTNRRAFGEQSTRVAYVLVRLALLLRGQGQLVEARDRLMRALEIQLEAAGSSSLDTADTRSQLSVTYRLLGDLTNAKEYCHVALRTRQKLLPEKHPQIASSLFNSAVILFEMGEDHEARNAAAKAYEMRRDLLGEEHERTVECRRLLMEGLTREDGRAGLADLDDDLM